MTTNPDKHQREADRVAEQLMAWAQRRPEIRALAIVGSRARGTARPDSDLDLIILTDTPQCFTDSDDWLAVLNSPPIISRQRFGVIAERRIQLPSGLEIEFGIGSPRWAATPVDPGTARVIRDGIRILPTPRDSSSAFRPPCEPAADRPARRRSTQPQPSFFDGAQPTFFDGA